MVPLTLIERLIALFQNGDMKSVQSTKETKEDNSTKLPEETNPAMLNTLAISSDQETLYLIDNDRAIKFPLISRNGIIIGTLKGQITVTSAKENPDTGEDTGGDLPRKIRVTTENSQWSGFYNEENEVFGLIGVSEIDISIAEPKTQVFFVDLKKSVINMKRKGILLELTVFPKEKGGGS